LIEEEENVPRQIAAVAATVTYVIFGSFLFTVNLLSFSLSFSHFLARLNFFCPIDVIAAASTLLLLL